MSYYYKYTPHNSGEVNKPEPPKAPNPWLATAAPAAAAPAFVACQVASLFHVIADSIR